MTTIFGKSTVAGLVCLALTACKIPLGGWNPGAQSLEPVPAGTVEQAALPPPDTLSADGEPFGTDTQTQEVASLGEQAVAGPPPGESTNILLGRADLLGGWSVESEEDNCQLFMSLTSWSGGYRATTRGCNSSAMQAVSAWNLTGQQVSLMDSGGISVARLFASSKTRFSGQTETGQTINVFR